MELDQDICYRAIQARDPRFDGQFFTAVRTTRAYCRPTCPAPTPKLKNCTFFRDTAAAQESGYRPCLRCRPELAPDLFAALGPRGIIAKALRLIATGILDDGTVGGLARRLHVTERHLRRLCVEYLGAAPVAIAQNRRILFAKHLITETNLPFTEVALAAGFGSIRRFNTVMHQTYGRSPRDLRQRRDDQEVNHPQAPITLQLAYTHPYDWPAMHGFLAKRAIPGMERVTATSYQRTIRLDQTPGIVEVHYDPERAYLRAVIRFPQVARLRTIVEGLRRVFDLHTDIRPIAQQLHEDPTLAPLIAARPGLRVPGAWDTFELAVRAILGQQVSVAGATTLAGRLVAAYGEPGPPLHNDSAASGLSYCFPEPHKLVQADLTSIGITRTRAATLQRLARIVVDNPAYFSDLTDLDDAVTNLTAIPGIGPWTAHYIAMRALGEADAFPAADVGLLGAMRNLGYDLDAKGLHAHAEGWRPWRAYAAMHLWQSAADGRIES